MARTRTLRSQETFVVSAEAPPWAHKLALEMQLALARKQDATNFGPFTYKSDIIIRMTDDQLDTFNTLLNQTTPRMRLMWEAIQAVYRRSPFWEEFYGMFVEEFGMSEADRILEFSGNA